MSTTGIYYRHHISITAECRYQTSRIIAIKMFYIYFNLNLFYNHSEYRPIRNLLILQLLTSVVQNSDISNLR